MLSASFVPFPLTGYPQDGNESFVLCRWDQSSKNERQNRRTLDLKLWHQHTSLGILIPRRNELQYCLCPCMLGLCLSDLNLFLNY